MMRNPASPLRIAMWSGPRNISTALMRSFGNRPDTQVIDEPFYACYLERTGLEHPGREEVLASQPRDWESVISALTGPVPDGKPIWYQKHMAHHILNDCPLEWLDDPSFRHVFLIRRPQPMLRSLLNVLGEATIQQTGLPQQVRLLQAIRQRRGATPLVVDADDVLRAPGETLERLCHYLGISFCQEMLGWPAGPRPTDGVWGKYWYDRVNESTCFSRQPTGNTPLGSRYEPLLRECDRLYAELADCGANPTRDKT